MGLTDTVRTLVDTTLDRSIALSFDRTGFWRHQRQFLDPNLELDLTGRTVAITGANSGLGFATAESLAARGAHVLLLCRSSARMADAIRRLQTALPTARLSGIEVDLSDWCSIDAAADLPVDHLDVLIHNAGILPAERTVLPTGLESTLATNLVGPLRLTARLLPLLCSAAAPRMIHVSSGGMYTQRLDLPHLNKSDGAFDGVRAYAHTKRCQVVLTELLAARWQERLAVHAMHPGWADTPGVRTSLPLFFAVTRAVLRTPAEGADTTAWLAALPSVPGPSGSFWFDRALAETHLSARTVATDAEREALWHQLLEWAGLSESDLELSEPPCAR